MAFGGHEYTNRTELTNDLDNEDSVVDDDFDQLLIQKLKPFKSIWCKKGTKNGRNDPYTPETAWNLISRQLDKPGINFNNFFPLQIVYLLGKNICVIDYLQTLY